MKRILAPLLMISIFVSGCRSLLNQKYQVNRPFTFKTKKEYFNYLGNKKGFGGGELVYLDSMTHPQIVNLLSGPFSVYYGSFINDSTMIKKSDFLMDNESCMGRMDGEIKKNIMRKQFVDSFLIKTNVLKNLNFRTTHNQPAIIDNANKRLKVFLIYTYAQGSVYDYIYKEVYKTYASTQKGFDLYILSFDPVYHLPD